ncbi:uncharacterized protein [Eurosta solidaginis]|uniref:uncharacterized protein n=1 Tax=Eurosta solidaginis TaxID=178769 RepID=UPI003531145B
MSAYREMSKLENSRNCLRRIARHDEPQFSKDSIVNVMEKFVKSVKVMDDTILVPCLLMDRQVGDCTDIIPAPGKNSTSNQHTLEHSGAHGKRNAAHSKNVNEFLSSSELFNLYNMLKVLKNDLLWTGKDDSEEDEQDGICEEQRLGEMENPIPAHCDSNKSEATNASNSSCSAATEAAASRCATTNNAATTNATMSNTVVTANTAVPSTTQAGTTSVTATTTTNTKGHNRRPSNVSVASIVSTTSVCNLSDAESEISQENDSGMESEGHKSDNQPSSTESVSGSDDTDSRAAAVANSNTNADKATELAKRCRRHLNGLYQCLEQMTEAAHYLTVRYQSDISPV